MATRDVLTEWVTEALTNLGGSAPLLNVTKEVWRVHQHDLEASGELFYTWQYDLRWAATKLRKVGVLEGNAAGAPWRLVQGQKD